MDKISYTMKTKITTVQAATLLEVVRKIVSAGEKSPTILALMDIDKHDLQKVTSIFKNLGK